MANEVGYTLVDTNVIVDVVSEDRTWSDWSAAKLAESADSGELVINPIIYAEVSIAYATIEDLDAMLGDDYLREELPYTAAFLAGKAYRAYRRSGGSKRSPLPNFYIGAHAAVCGYRLLTRDRARYQTYFPSLMLVAP